MQCNARLTRARTHADATRTRQLFGHEERIKMTCDRKCTFLARVQVLALLLSLR